MSWGQRFEVVNYRAYDVGGCRGWAGGLVWGAGGQRGGC